MESVFSLYGSQARYYFEHVSNYYKSKNFGINSNAYEVAENSKAGVYLASVKSESDHLHPVKEKADPIVSMGSFASSGAPKLSTDALKDRAFIDQIALDHLNAVNSITGSFILIYWDEATSELRFSCSAFNPRTLYYAWLDDCLIVSSDLALIQFLLPPKVDHLSITLWLSGRPDPNRSMFSNIHQLPFAHSISVNANMQLKCQRFWDIDPNNELQLANETEYKDALYRLLQQSVKDELSVSQQGSSASPIFSQMSGGMDSTSITSLLHSQDIDLHTVSHTYKQTQSCNEIDNINDMREFLTLEHSHFVELDQFTDISFTQLYPTQSQNPGVVASPKYLQEAEIIKQFGGIDLFTGNGGDEMCWGHSLAYRDRLASGDFGVIKEVLGSARKLGMSPMAVLKQVLIKPMLPASLLSLLGKQPIDAEHCPGWLSEQQHESLSAIDKHNPFGQSKQLAKRARYEGLFHTSTFNSMRSYQHICDQYGIRVHHPFFNKALAEFSFAIPQKLHIQSQYPKYLLRKAMDSHLPKSVCWNQHKTVFDQHFANLVRANKTELRTLLSHPGLQDLGLVDNNKLLSSFDRVVNAQNGSLNVDLLYAILTQSWYQTHILGEINQ